MDEQIAQYLEVHSCDETLSRHARVMEGLRRAGIDTMRVIVKNRSGSWQAQGLELDYAVGGSSCDDVIAEFAQSLALTIDDHLRIHGHIGHIVRAAQPDVWSAFFDGVVKETLEMKRDLLTEFSIPAWVYVEKAA